jgi:hypothetical protein
MSSSSDFFDLILVGTPQFWQIGGLDPVYLQVRRVSVFIGRVPDSAPDAVATWEAATSSDQAIGKGKEHLDFICLDRVPVTHKTLG